MRKAVDLDLVDRIKIDYYADEGLAEAVAAHAELICRETLAVHLQFSADPGGDHLETFEIGGMRLVIGLVVVK
jgi:hypothetical protein